MGRPVPPLLLLLLLTVVVLAVAPLSAVLGASVLPTHRDARTGEHAGIGLANTRRPGGGRAVPLPPAHLMTSPIPVPRGRKGASNNDRSISTSFEYDAEQFAPLTWFAPVLSGGGYCSEALAFAQALYPFFSHHDDGMTILIGNDIGPPKQKKSKLRVVQHGDGVNGMFLRGLDEYTRDLLMKELLLGPPSASSSDAQFGGVVVCHSEPGAWDPAHYETSLCPPPQARWKVGRTMFETDRLPSGWSERLNRMDRVWVPTEFARGVFERAGVEPAKIRVVPEPVDSDFFSPDYARQLHALPGPAGRPFVFPGEIVPGAEADGRSPRRPFRFLSVFKFEERKNWKGLIEAFMREFSGDAPPLSSSANKGQEVVLYILTSAYHTDAAFDARIREFVSTMSWGIGAVEPRYLPPVRLLKSDLPATELVKLYAAVDCVVLPSRGEGWGRPHVEAMSMGLPLIATRWSGPEAFMTDSNSFPLRHEPELVEVTEGAFRGHKWAQPSQEHLRELMRLVVSEPDLAAQRGAQGRKDMQRHFCPRCVARIVLRELADLQGLKPVREVPAEEDFSDEDDTQQQLNDQEHYAETTSARGSRRDEL
jgi:glycosyltransferase involved in cell wall biosynthesis